MIIFYIFGIILTAKVFFTIGHFICYSDVCKSFNITGDELLKKLNKK